MKIGMCTGDETLKPNRDLKKNMKKELSDLKYPKFHNFSLKKETFGICANSRVDIEISSVLGVRKLHMLSYEVLHIGIC